MRLRTLMLAGAFALSACASTPTVNYDSDPNANFAAYHTYSWAYSATPQGMNPLTFQRIKASIDRSLTARGYTQATDGQFAIGFTVGRRDRVEVTDFGGYGYRPYGGWRGYGYGGYNNVDVRNVTDGTLVIDIYDGASKQPVWHGTATQEVSGGKVDQALIDGAVDAVLAKFPPPPPKS